MIPYRYPICRDVWCTITLSNFKFSDRGLAIDPSHKSHNALQEYREMHQTGCTWIHFCYQMVGYGTGAFWDSDDGSIVTTFNSCIMLTQNIILLMKTLGAQQDHLSYPFTRNDTMWGICDMHRTRSKSWSQVYPPIFQWPLFYFIRLIWRFSSRDVTCSEEARIIRPWSRVPITGFRINLVDTNDPSI